MLKKHEVQWVKQLSEQGLSRRAISHKTGFARDTVRKILDGRRPDYEALRLERELEETPLFSGPIERCSTCGGMVYIPCILCHARQFREAELKEPATVDLTTALRRRRGDEDRQRTDSMPSHDRRRCA